MVSRGVGLFIRNLIREDILGRKKKIFWVIVYRETKFCETQQNGSFTKLNLNIKVLVSEF